MGKMTKEIADALVSSTKGYIKEAKENVQTTQGNFGRAKAEPNIDKKKAALRGLLKDVNRQIDRFNGVYEGLQGNLKGESFGDHKDLWDVFDSLSPEVLSKLNDLQRKIEDEIRR